MIHTACYLDYPVYYQPFTPPTRWPHQYPRQPSQPIREEIDDFFKELHKEIKHATQDPNKGNSFPFYDIITVPEQNQLRVEVALAGYDKEDLTVKNHDGHVQVEGKRKDLSTEEEIVRKGIKRSDFSTSFKYDKKLEFSKAKFENGILHLIFEFKKEFIPQDVQIE